MRCKSLRLWGARDARVESVEVSARADAVLIDVVAAGVCGSDLHVYRTGEFVPRFPVTPGHEVAGRVVDAAHGFAAGELVVADSRVYCSRCDQCAAGHRQRCRTLGFLGEVVDGGFAQRCALDPRVVFRVPLGLDGAVAVLAEPTAVVLHALTRVRRVADRHERVLILGGGPIGTLQALVIGGGADVVIIEPHAARRAACAEATGRPVRAASDGLVDADVVYDCAGHRGSLTQAAALCRPGGVVAAVALHHHPESIDANAIIAGEQLVIGCHVFEDELDQALAVLAAAPDRFRRVITDTVTLDELPGLVAQAAVGDYHGLKIIVDPGRG